MKHKYFTLEELIRSNTATTKGIDNTPSWEVVEQLDLLVSEILDPLREAWGKPIRISSGFRCPRLNQAVGGAATSVHKIGAAADMQTPGNFSKFRDFVKAWLLENNIAFDQLLVEKRKKDGAQWLHIGRINNAGQQRKQIQVMVV